MSVELLVKLLVDLLAWLHIELLVKLLNESLV